jgi:uncharacterized repeat protein (TIGR03803 family)
MTSTSTTLHSEGVHNGCKRSLTSVLKILALLTVAFLAAQSARAQKYTVLYSFTEGGGDGVSPASRLFRDSTGNLYGTTRYGGLGNGTIFKLDMAGTESVLYAFPGDGTQGLDPEAGVISDSEGNLYGTTVQGGMGAGEEGYGIVYKLDKAGNLTVLTNFGSLPNGKYPTAGLRRDSVGNLYGTTAEGGIGYGNVFKLDPAGTENVLYSFTSGFDGRYPIVYGALIADSDGNLYGTTAQGGDPTCDCGTVFKLSPAGTLTVLHTFTGGPGDGLFPVSGLVRDKAGNLYGTTQSGGTTGGGTVFKVDPAGVETVIYNFAGPPDGYTPTAGLILAVGNLYGTTNYGGRSMQSCGTMGCGTIFKLNLNTGIEKVLHSFRGREGAFPRGSLVRDEAGNLYGTALEGGAGKCRILYRGCGVVFKLAP